MSNKLSDEIESLCFLVQGGQKEQNGQEEQDGQRIPLWPYVVAVTGHRFFAKPKEVKGLPGYKLETIKNAFRKELESLARLWKDSCKGVNAPLILLTGLSDGADQLAAEVALEDTFKYDLNVKVVAVLPMEEQLFKLTVKDKKKFEFLIDQAYLKYELPLLEKSTAYRRKITDVDNRKTDKYREKQYKFLG